MKKLTGTKNNFSSLENKRLADLKSIQGGNYAIRSNTPTAEGCVEYDYYTGPGGTGTYVGRGTLCVSNDVN